MSNTPEGTTESRYRLLLVGESDALQEVRERLRHGFGTDSVTTVSTAAAALDRVDETDCLVCDPAAVSTLADATDLPVVAITTSDESAAIDDGATDVLSPAASVSLARARIQTVVAGTASSRDRDRAERYRSIFDASTAVVLVTERDGTVEWASPATDRSLGYTPAELEGDDLESIVHPDDRETVTAAVATVADGQLDDRTQVNCRLRLGSGRLGRHGIDIRNRLSDPAISGLVFTVLPAADEPTTERGAARGAHDAAVRAGDVDRITDPILTLDDDWVVTSANRAAGELLESPDESPVGHEIWELLPPDTLPSWFEELSAARARDVALTFDVPAADDGIHTVTAYPAAGALTMIARRRDETVATRMQSELDATATLLDAVPTPAFLVEDDRISIANAATFEYADRATVVGRRLEAVLDGPIASAVSERADASIRRVDPIEWTPTVGGTERTVELSVVPLADDRAVVVGVDVTRRRRLTGSVTTLSETVGSLLESTSVDSTRRALTGGIRSAFDVPVAVWYGADDDQLTPRASLGLADSTQPPPISIAGSRRSAMLSGDPTALGPDERIPVGDGVVIVDPIAIPVGDGDVVVAGATDRSDPTTAADVDASADGREAVSESPPEGRDGGTGEFEGISELPVDERPLGPGGRERPGPAPTEGESGSGEDVRLGPIGGLIGELAPLSLSRAACFGEKRDLSGALEAATRLRDRVAEVTERRTAINHTLRTAETRSALERALCRELVQLDAVGFAVIAAHVDADVDLRAHAGAVPSSLTDEAARASALVDPIVEAGRTRNQVVVSIDGAAGDRFADYGDIGSVIATPVAGTNRTYGVLGVYATERPGTEILPTLCADVATGGFLAIDSIETRDALLAEDTIELELSVPVSGDDVLTGLVAAVETTVDLDAVAPGDDESTLYVTVRASADRAVREALESHPAVSAARRLKSSDGNTKYEIAVAYHPLVDAVASYGGVLTTATAQDGRALLRVELPADRDVRSVVEGVQSTVPDVELVARRPTSRHGEPAAGSREILAELTDRQREILRTAYAAGYFEVPRDRTGEEIATQLGISQPTFTRHFRAAERTIFDELFGE